MNLSDKVLSYLKSEKLKGLTDRFKKDKKIIFLSCFALLGVLMISVSEIDDDKINDAQYEANETVDFENEEKKLKSIISCINGVGDVEVYITYDCAYETVYAVNSELKTDDEQYLSKSEYIITDEDTGLVLKKIYPKIRGVAVVCQGGADPFIIEKIYSVVSALFGISTNRISVADME